MYATGIQVHGHLNAGCKRRLACLSGKPTNSHNFSITIVENVWICLKNGFLGTE